MDRYDFKERAKEALSEKWIVAAIGALIVAILSGRGWFVGNSSATAFGNVSFNYSGLITLILTGPMTLGFINFIYALKEGKDDYGLLFSGFRRFGDVFLYHFLTSLVIMLGFILFIVPGIVWALGYSMGYFLMRDDPDMTATEAMQASKALMNGYKMDFFKFLLSFFGLMLLSIITLGIGFLFLHPYFVAAQANYYEKLKEIKKYEVENDRY